MRILKQWNRRRSGSSIVVLDGDDLKPCLPDDYISGQHHLNHQQQLQLQQQLQQQHPLQQQHYRTHSGDIREIDQEMLTMLSVNQDNGPHREMAVDCPDTFIARNKTPPRYPPPRPPQKQHQATTAMAATQVAQQQTPSHKLQATLSSDPNGNSNSNNNSHIVGISSSSSSNNSSITDDFLCVVDGLYQGRKDTASPSSSAFDEVMSKHTLDSFGSIAYRHLHQQHQATSNGNSSSNTSNTNSNTNSNINNNK
uniref:IP15845p n=1 Tax=Drosophila melanogaster TaxID=7227 RepID=B3LF67_DROME|nr:IP15845p [Drosophila melanogaster]